MSGSPPTARRIPQCGWPSALAEAGFAFGQYTGLLAVLCACVVAGTYVGSHALHRVNERTFTWLYRSVLSLVALRLVMTPLFAG